MSNNQFFLDGAEAAAKLLLATADDYDQMAKQQEEAARSPEFMFPHQRHKLLADGTAFRVQARLLRGQAQLVRRIRP